MIEDRRGEGRFWATAAFAVVVIIALILRDPAPRPQEASSPADAFSSERARQALERVLSRESPHPVGSEEHDRVRERIVEELRAIGLEPSVEELLVCNERGSCALVRNLSVLVEGRQAGPAVLVNAHYDSVAASPGAGDDGVGLAVVLESARALTVGPKPERPIRLLIDDAEEAGLLGAEAWVKTHSPEETLAVIVLEARGSSGPALMFETNRMNLPLVRSYAKSASSPATSSVFFSIYERLPNRTNFTVFKREGYAGMAVAMIEDPAHYHTPLNNLSNLSDASLQHMGELTLGMVRDLSANGLGGDEVTASYFDLVGATVIYWPESWNLWLSVAGLVLVSIVAFSSIRSERASAIQILLGWLVMALALVAAGVAGWAVWKLALLRSGDSMWIANAGFLVCAMWLVGAAIASVPYVWVRRAPARLSIWAAVWLLQGMLAIVCSRLLPGAAYLFFVPTIAAGLMGLVTIGRGRPERGVAMTIVPFALSLLLVVPIVDGLYTGLGLVALPGVAAAATLLLLPLMAASTEARRPAMLTMACAALTFVCLAAYVITPVHSSEVPRALNVAAVIDDEGATAVVLLGDADPMPDGMIGAADFSKQPVDAFRRSGNERSPRLWTAQMRSAELGRIDLSASSFELLDEGGRLRVVGGGVIPGSVIRLWLPENSSVEEVSYGGRTVRLDASIGESLTLRGVPANGFSVTATTAAGGAGLVIEERPGLPREIEDIAQLRTDRETEIGPGDRTVVVSVYSVDDLPARIVEESESPEPVP